jgi:hypothetical protein
LSYAADSRPVEDSDLDGLFDQMREPEGVWIAAFTAKDPNDRNAEIEETILLLD